MTDSQLEDLPTLSEAQTTILESINFITKEGKIGMINEFQELNLFIPEDHEIMF